jgi:ABC-type uncharacterized transport system substrate-binding protein
VKRRTFIAGLGGAAAWPLLAQSEPQTAPLIGFIDPGDSVGHAYTLESFRRGLKEAGYVDGDNVTTDARWLNAKPDQASAIVADLIDRQVAVIASTTPGAVAARKATSTIPIVFATGGDPVKLGLV